MKKINYVPNYHCQKILPSVYDDELSYYEYLCKLTDTMNKIIDIINDEFETLVSQKIDEFFNDIMVDAIYKEDEETIYLKKRNNCGRER